MSLSAARMAFGLAIPGSHFSIPGNNGHAAGWPYFGGTVVASGITGPDLGYPRAQRYVLAAAGDSFAVLSQPARIGHLCRAGTLTVASVLHLRSSVAALGVLRLWLEFRDSTDTLIGSRVQVGALTGSMADWGVLVQTQSVTIPALVHHVRLYLAGAKITAGGTDVWDVAFASVGFWEFGGTAAATYTWPDYTSRMPESTISQRKNDVTLASRRLAREDRRRRFDPIRVSMPLELASDALAQRIRHAWAINAGRITEGTTQPEGLPWPILLVPGSDAAIGAILCDFEAPEFPLRPVAWSETPRWSGEISFRGRA